MANDDGHDAPSPSASSIFLPLGRRSRRESRASSSIQVDKESLMEALDNIHTAASQSQTLTVFNEYTSPPPASTTVEHKGLAGELQGGLTGLYNKIRASVGGAKDLPPAIGKPVEGQLLSDDASTRSSGRSTPSIRPMSHGTKSSQSEVVTSFPTSTQASRLHSPTLTSFENPSNDSVSHAANPSRLLAKPLSTISRSSGPSAPAIKSPIGATPNTNTADPTVSEVTVNAVKDDNNHLSAGSKQDLSQDNSTIDARKGKEEEMSSRKTSSHASRGPDFPEHQLPSPRMKETIIPDKKKGNGRKVHERGDSLQSIHLPESATPQHSRSSTMLDGSTEATAKMQEVQPLSRVSTRESSTTLPKSPHPLRLVTGDTSTKKGAAALPLSLDTASTAASSSFSGNGASPVKRPTERLTPRVSQSRLPGFARTASSDSTVTGSGIGPHIRFSNAGPDSAWELKGRADGASTSVVNKMKSKLLSREFWMRDENAKDCFHCQEPFSTFRRKHHCRTCGQIFDSRCTTLLPGHHFGVGGNVRVCLPCEAMINAHDSDSSDYSADGLSLPSPMATFRPHTPISEQQLKQDPTFDDDDTASVVSQSLDQMAKTPTMGIPVRRAVDSSNRRSLVMEFDAGRAIPRPSSSRSLRTSHSIGHGHRRNHSKHQHIRNFKAYHEDRAPFQRRIGEEEGDGKSAFHRDSIIDPDLNQYLSDNTSSDDEPSNMFSTTESKMSKSAPESDKTPLGGLLAGVKKGRSRLGERYLPGLLNPPHDGDDVSVNSSRAVNLPRSARRRNLSVASSVKQYLSPRSVRDPHNLGVPQTLGTPSPLSSGQSPLPGRFRMTRSASMKGAGAPAIELNRASLQHVRKLLQQLLKDAEIPRAFSWETALIPILLKATDDVDPDVQHGDDLDIRHYVKLKKIPGGRPGDTSYVSGLVFTKNLALKSMPRSIVRPKILIITFPLEYARYEQHFMSLEPVIRQEREFLENLVNRIAALGPHLLLAQRNVSGLALQLLEKANIATAYNVKPSVLEAVSRCSQTRIITSMDKLAMRPALVGNCESFDVKTYVFNGRKRTYMFISGCPPQLGCTITLRGAERETLINIKRITDFMMYVVYNLKLETCLMRDEFALIPSAPEDGPSTDGKASHAATLTPSTASNLKNVNDRLNTQSHEITQHGLTDTASSDGNGTSGCRPPIEPARLDSTDSGEIPDDIPDPAFYEDLVEKHQTKILSASPFVKFMQPYLLMRARELERRVAYLKRLRDQDVSSDTTAEEKTKGQKFTLIQPEMVHTSLTGASQKVREILHAVHDSEYDKALHNHKTQKRQWETYLSGNRNLFDPYSHQNIVVLYSQVCTSTSIPCFGPELLALGFYDEHESEGQFVPDSTLGQYVEDLCLSANNACTANGCERKMFEHHRQYVHGEAQVSVFVHPHPSKMRGMQETILMWSQCKICGNETPVIPMSSGSWKYSFGKYLELSFWSADLHARAGICPHDLHRDHLRYFGYKDFALRFHYDSISLLEIIVPRMRITWKVDNDLRFRNDVYTRIEQRINRFMLSVKSRIKAINVEAVMPEISEACQQEIDVLSKRASEEHVALIKHLQDRYVNSHHWETIPLNGALRATQEKVADWDTTFSEFEKNFFPSEKDIRRLATLQLKKIFLDRDVSVTSVTSTEEGVVTPTSETTVEEKLQDHISTDDQTPASRPGRPRKMTQLSPEKTQDVLQSVIEEHSGAFATDTVVEDESNAHSNSEKTKQLDLSAGEAQTRDVRALDLAVPTANHGRAHSTQGEINLSHTPMSSEESQGLFVQPNNTLSQQQTDTSDKKDDDHLNNYKGHPAFVTNPPPSSIPRPTDSRRVAGDEKHGRSPPLLRAQSQPANTFFPRPENSSNSSTPGPVEAIGAMQGFGSEAAKALNAQPTPPVEKTHRLGEKKLSDRIGWNHLKSSKLGKGHSLIPRSVHGKRDSRVSNLAKHFEQLSREFEKERIKERRQRAATNRQSRAYPLASSKPIVEVYKNVHDAVEEKDHSDESSMLDEVRGDVVSPLPESSDTAATADTPTGFAHTNPADSGEGFHREDDTTIGSTAGETEPPDTRTTLSETEEEHSDLERSLLDDIKIPESPEELAKMTPEDIDLKELPKNERTSLMKMLTTFWAERSSSGWDPLDYPLNASDHIFADSNIVVREDEPSSLIAFALDSEDYKSKLRSIQEHHDVSSPGNNGEDNQADVMHSLLRATGTHLKYGFTEGPAKMMCKVFYAEQFDAVRRKCGVSDRIVESLSRCLKWDSKGGKTKSLFLKTLDDRFVLKSLSPIETQAFLKFAPAYFQIMSEAFFHELPSVIAKMLGFYQVIIKNPITGVECNWFLLVMENLFYDRVPTRIFDLKGSMRNRKIHSTGATNEVLLDENMVEFIYESPLFAREHSKKLLRGSVHNDTLFLARQNVMDYSLMVAIDEVKKELVVGIIDCIRTYTWDKKLESWIKERGLGGGGGGRNRPTVTSPKEYKKRFREAMGRYVLEAPK